MNRFATFLAQPPRQLEAQQGAHAVPEERGRYIEERADVLGQHVDQGSDPRERRLSETIAAPRQVDAANLNAVEDIGLPGSKNRRTGSCVRKAEQPHLRRPGWHPIDDVDPRLVSGEIAHEQVRSTPADQSTVAPARMKTSVSSSPPPWMRSVAANSWPIGNTSGRGSVVLSWSVSRRARARARRARFRTAP